MTRDLDFHYQSMARSVTSVTEYIGVLQHRWPMRMPFFRGESKKHDVPMLPAIWRDSSPSNPWGASEFREPLAPPAVWTVGEDLSVQAFKEWASASRRGRDRFLLQYGVPEADFSPEWIPLAQHFGFPTRLIDVTLDPLVALYFASLGNPEEDGFVFGGQEGAQNTLEPEEHSNDYRTVFDIYDIRGYKPQENTPFHYRPLANSERMVLQKGQFLWCRGAGKSIWHGGAVIKVASEAKPRILEQLGRLNYGPPTLPPDRELEDEVRSVLARFQPVAPADT